MSSSRSTLAQIARMKRFWPGFVLVTRGPERFRWVGHLKPEAQVYCVLVDWVPGEVPSVSLLEPKLQPRPSEDYIDIPHINIDLPRPELSTLCLFDPDNREWCSEKFISDTIVPWTAEWLWRYEQWHLLGEWIGTGVGPETFREALQVEKLRKDERNGG